MDTDTLTRTPAWLVAGRLLDALTRRDFASLGSCLEPDVRFRALVPPGPFELGTAAAVEAKFAGWFGGEDRFEVVDATASRIGTKVYLRWRIRMTPAEGPSREAEQHLYLSGEDRVAAIDLLCSGFQADQGVAA